MANIVGVALSQAGKFLGFVDGKGKIRKGRVRKVNVGSPRVWSAPDPRHEQYRVNNVGGYYAVRLYSNGVPIGSYSQFFSTKKAAKNYANRLNQKYRFKKI